MIPVVITGGFSTWAGVQYLPTMGFLGPPPINNDTPNIWLLDGRATVWAPAGRLVEWQPDGRTNLWQPRGRF